VAWLRERKVLLPGVTTLARLVARVRDETTHRLWRELEGLLTPAQRRMLDRLLEVGPGGRVSDLERWRKGPPPRGSGPAIIKALDQVAEITALGLAGTGAEALVPPRRLGELARYGMTADAWLIRRHPDDRRMATLLATVRHLEARSVDDALELLDLLMSAELVNKAQRESDRDKARRHPRLARASARLAVAVEALFDSDGWGGPDDEPRVSQVWEAIEAVVSRAELRVALALVTESVPPPDAEDPDDWRAQLLSRYPTVSGFLKLLPGVISFGATAEGAPVLAAMRALPDVLAYRSRLPGPLIPGRLIDAGVVTGPWRRLVFGHPTHADGAVSRHAYAFCVLEQFWRYLKAPRHLRRRLDQVAQPAGPAAGRPGVDSDSRRRADHPRPARRPGRAAGRARPGAGCRLPGSRRAAGRQHRGHHRRRREDPPDRGQGHRGAAILGRPARPHYGHAPAGRPAGGDPGGHVLGAGTRGGVHPGLRRPVPAR
jgi:hypothetical protein